MTTVKTLPIGTRVRWHYRSAIGHGKIAGIQKLGRDHATTKYKIEEFDHHVSSSGSREGKYVYHYGSALTRESSNTKDVFGSMDSGTIRVGLGTRIQHLGPIPRHKKRKKKVRVVIEGTKSAQILSNGLKVLDRYRRALEDGSSVSARIRPLPEALPDGTDITTLDEMAVVSGLHRKAVPFAVLEHKGDANPELVRAAMTELGIDQRSRRRTS